MAVYFIMIMTIFVWKTEKGPILPQNIDVLTQGQNVLKTHVPTRIHHHCNGPTKLLAHWQKGFENTRPTRLHHQWRISTNTRHSQSCMVLHGAYLMVFHCIQGNCMGSEKGFKDHV